MNDIDLPVKFHILNELMAADSPAGDEYRTVDQLTGIIQRIANNATVVTLGSSVIAIRGSSPQVVVIAHHDTTGFTLGYDRLLVPIGTPAPEHNDGLRCLNNFDDSYSIDTSGRKWVLTGNSLDLPGSRFVYSTAAKSDGAAIIAPYLDNRAGIWAAFEVLQNCKNVAVAFTSGEETSGLGARVCGRYLYDRFGIAKALISDITWHTDHVRIGQGPAVSLRDSSIPNQKFISLVKEIADESGIPHQIEIESDGGSDGAHLDCGDVPIDWAFVGAPEEHPHSSHEKIRLDDLSWMASLLQVLVDNLSQ